MRAIQFLGASSGQENRTSAVPRLLSFLEVAEPEQERGLEKEVAALPSAQLLYESGDNQVFVARSHEIPMILLEIGRLREQSFRSVGEGTGKARDLDVYDGWYEHLFVWSRRKKQVLGAYRLARTEYVLRNFGLGGLYSRSLFRFDTMFLRKLGPAVELGRSFVRPECQGVGRVLAMLWRGVGRYVARASECRALFGAVSISPRYSEDSRSFMATALSSGRFRHSLAPLVSPIRPLTSSRHPVLEPGDPSLPKAVRALSSQVAKLDPEGRKLPVLVAEYLKLGGRFCSFSLDPGFGNVLDGLVVVNLDETHPRLLSLHMGDAGLQSFAQTMANERTRRAC